MLKFILGASLVLLLMMFCVWFVSMLFSYPVMAVFVGVAIMAVMLTKEAK